MKKILFLCFVLLLSLDIKADQFFTGYSMFNTYTAKTLPLGYLQLSTQERGYINNDITPVDVIPFGSIVNASGYVGGNYGYTNNLELGANLNYYQDLNRYVKMNGNINSLSFESAYLRIKYRGEGMEIGNKYFGLWALASSIRFSTTSEPGMVLEPYWQPSAQVNLTGIFSFYFDQLYMEEGESAHLNLGYIMHNDGIEEQPKKLLKGVMEFTYALGYKYPISYFDLNLELYGNALFNLFPLAEKNQYSTKPYLYITPSVKYKIFAGIDVDLGTDLLLYTTYDNYGETKVDESPLKSAAMPYFPEWRLLFRLNYYPSTFYADIPTFAPASSASSPKNRVSNSHQVSSRRELFEWLIEEPDRVEYIDIKLDKLRKERKSIEENINEIKSEMDAQKDKP